MNTGLGQGWVMGFRACRRRQWALCKAVIGGVVSVALGLAGSRAIAQSNGIEARDRPPAVAEPGWQVWRPLAEAPTAHFDAGFSNAELDGYRDFQNACQRVTGLPNESISYWFRLNRLVAAIGTGRVEYGCWLDGQFLFVHSSTAIRTDVGTVNCLRVTSDVGNGLVVRSEPTTVSLPLGTLANGRTVDPGSFPAIISQRTGRDWLKVRKPIEGWVSVGETPDGSVNLKLCNRS